MSELRVYTTADDLRDARRARLKVSELNADLAQPLVLICAEGYSYREASEALGIPIGKHMSRIHRARKLLVARLSAEEFAQS